jgi:uncharacterized membrane protein
MKKTIILVISLVILLFVLGVYLYPQLPERIVSHWNAKGEANGTMSKFWGIFLLPVITLAIVLLFIFIPKLDPLKKNIEKFRSSYNHFIVLFVLFMLTIYLHSLLWNLGIQFDVNLVFPIALGVLFFYLGVLLPRMKRNWFIGIRTPWTLSSDKVWDKTHKLGSKLFKASGIISVLGIFFKDYAIWFMIIPIILAAILSAVYSFIVYKRLN